MVNSKSCIICGSKSNLFSFPNDESERKRWATAMKIKPAEITYNTDKICKRHFLTHQFKYASKKKLKPDAVPTLNFLNEDSEQIESTAKGCESTENRLHENQNQERLDMCLLCGYVSASSFHRFPKNCLLKLQWAKFCELLFVEIESYHRLCNKHFVSVHDRHKVPTLYPKKHFQCNEALRNEEVIPIVEETIENIPIHCENNENLRECSPTIREERIIEVLPVDAVVPDCSPATDLDSNFVTPQPVVYFKRYGDIKAEDVVTPRRAVLSLKMGKDALEKCRKKLRRAQTEKNKLKITVESLEKQLLDLQQKHLLSQQAMQNILANMVP